MTWLESFSAAEVSFGFSEREIVCEKITMKLKIDLLFFQAVAEVKTKLLPTYCIAVTIWPVIGVSLVYSGCEKSMNFVELF